MLILFETPVDLKLFKVSDEVSSQDPESIRLALSKGDAVKRLIKLESCEKFKNMEQALKVSRRTIEGKVSKKLKKLMKNYQNLEDSVLGVAEPKIGSALHELFNIECIFTPAVQEFTRAIREHYEQLVPDLDKTEARNMSIGLAHNFSRYKLKFNPDKIDTMIVQSINLLDDIDKEINNYVMRCKEWYSWHFPELSKIVSDNLLYAKLVRAIKYKNDVENVDFVQFVDKTVADEIKAAAVVSMGSDVTEDDMNKVVTLADHIIDLTNYRSTLMEYLVNRMRIVAPNLSLLVGEIVGARLIAHTGSLNNLSKQSASTVQVLGAEKALFNALKSRKNTPKYGLIYHAGLISQAPLKFKGKMSRSLAAKCSLAVRCDALSDVTGHLDRTIKDKAKLERRLAIMEQVSNTKIGQGGNKFQTKQEKYSAPSNNAVHYNPALDAFLPRKRTFKAENIENQEDKKQKP